VVENEYIQVLINIIANAKDILIERQIKNPQITITIDKVLVDTDEIANQAIVYISDNGGGIEAQQIDDIFKPYYSKRNFINSTGMGLFMSKVIIENHFDGEIRANNNNSGAVFTISLPHYE
jgi:signal transduction histidine kinase